MRVKIKHEAKEKFQRIREYKLLILGVLIGVFGNLIANVIDDAVKQNNSYPLYYIIILIVSFLIIIFLTLRTFFKWKFFIFRTRRLLNKAKMR